VNRCMKCRLPVTGAMTFEIEMDAFAEPELRESVLTQAELVALKLRHALASTSHHLPKFVAQAHQMLPPVGVVYMSYEYGQLIYAQPMQENLEFFGVKIDHLLVVSDVQDVSIQYAEDPLKWRERWTHRRFWLVIPTDDEKQDRLLVFLFNTKDGSITVTENIYLPVKQST